MIWVCNDYLSVITQLIININWMIIDISELRLLYSFKRSIHPSVSDNFKIKLMNLDFIFVIAHSKLLHLSDFNTINDYSHL